MKVEWVDTEDPGHGGTFVISADTAAERAILRRFWMAGMIYTLKLHSAAYSADLSPGGVTSIVFGLVDKEGGSNDESK